MYVFVCAACFNFCFVFLSKVYASNHYFASWLALLKSLLLPPVILFSCHTRSLNPAVTFICFCLFFSTFSSSLHVSNFKF